MIGNKTSRNGHKKRSYHRENTYNGPKCNWVGCPEGRTAKILIVLISEQYVKPGETYDRKFRASGLESQHIFEEAVRLMPWLPEWYEEKRPGWELTKEIVYDRWHKGTVYQTVTGRGKSYSVGQSSEHPRNNKRLMPLLEGVETLFKRNKPISIELAREVGEVG